MYATKWIRYNTDTIALTDEGGNMYCTIRAIKGRKNPNTWVVQGYSVYNKTQEAKTFGNESDAKTYGEAMAVAIMTTQPER